MLSEVASQLNLRLGNRYLFAGSKLDTPPVQLPVAEQVPSEQQTAVAPTRTHRSWVALPSVG